MGRIPFKKVMEAFDEIARSRLCHSNGSSSGSDHSTAEDSSPELSDLINSFMETADGSENDEEKEIDDNENDSSVSFESSYGSETSNNKELLLRSILDSGKDHAKETIRSETELVCNEIIGAEQGFKRRLMSHLRERGFDAGLCKSRCKKIGQFLAGDYEYVDVMVNGTRYIVEVNLSGEFLIARPTSDFQSLLDTLPQIFVGEADNLKQVVKLMGNAIKKSLKSSHMHAPPWRRNGYMLAKWFGSYKRTTNTIPKQTSAPVLGNTILASKQLHGFEMTPMNFRYCRGDLKRKSKMGNGNLAKVFGATNCT